MKINSLDRFGRLQLPLLSLVRRRKRLKRRLRTITRLPLHQVRFPFNEELAQKWIKKMGDPDLNCRTARICSDHFSEKDFEGSTGGKKNLKPKAVPSLYLTERKPRKGDSDNEDSDDESDRRKVDRKRRKGSKKMDTSAIVMPLPMIPEPEIKSEPPSDEEDVGQEYVAEDTTADDDLLKEIEAAEQKSRNTRSAAKQENAETPSSKRWRGRPRKLLDVSHVKADKLETPKIKTVTLSSLEGPKITLEKLSLRVIKAAESGSLRVRIKESPASKAIPHQKPCPKSKKKRPIESEESSDDDPKQSISSAEAEKLKKIKKPGPLSKKRKLLEKLESQEKHKAQAGRATGTSLLKSRKVLKTSDDDEEEEEDADDPAPMSPGDEEGADSPSSKSSSIVKVKPAELPKFLVDKKSGKGSLKRKLTDDAGEDVNSILSSDVSEHQKIAKLVDQRILEHTKIIDQRPAGPQQLVDHNKILQGSALVLKKLAEKTGKTLPASQIIPLNVPDNTSVTPGRTIVLKKVSDPGKLGLKPPISKRGESSKMSPNASIFKSSPTKSEVPSDETPGSVKPCSPLEKIRDYDNLMRKYLNAVADKSLVSRKFMEAKESQRTLETKLEEKEKELELVKKKVSVSQTRLNKIVSSLEHFLTPNQIKLALQETKKVAWTPEEMLMAFTIKHLSKACYLFLRHKLNYPLPGISSLQRWMGMLHKDKGGDDEDNIADDDALDKDETAEAVQQRDETGVMNEITGTLEEINASSIQSNKDDVYTPKVATTMTDDLICPTQSSSPFQIVYENDSSGQGTRKVVIVKKVLNVGGENKAKSMLQISASENDVNVNNIAGTGSKNEIYKMLPRAKTISMGGSAGASPSSQPKRVRYVVTKNTKEKEKLSFNRLPKVRQEPFLSKPPRIQVVKTEPDDSMHLQNEYLLQSTMPHEQHSTDMVDVNEMAAMETIVKPEDVMSQTSEVLTHQSIEESHKQIFTLSDLAATQGETIVESVDVEGGVDHEMISAEQLIQSGDLETITIMKEDGQFEQHQIRRQDAMGQQTFGASGLEQLVHMATSEEQQQITFATHHVPVVSEADGGVTPGEHYAQIAFAATQGSVPGEITLHEDMNNMTAVVINDIDEEQLNTLLMSNVVEQKDVTAEEAAAAGYQHKEIVYQTITDDKNVIVLQPDSQAFVEEDEGMLFSS
ncbi:unnamed protein product [Nesidiocoris tenuis]|uniref:THAP-type domain-containing protein n=1 Tax=Nesidiocoris tenuis TaxID=355587 RepID=A0A6H5G5S7_9HEMI|nr:unnamed protein product [Nesidiocoris tenuis]